MLQHCSRCVSSSIRRPYVLTKSSTGNVLPCRGSGTLSRRTLECVKQYSFTFQQLQHVRKICGRCGQPAAVRRDLGVCRADHSRQARAQASSAVLPTIPSEGVLNIRNKLPQPVRVATPLDHPLLSREHPGASLLKTLRVEAAAVTASTGRRGRTSRARRPSSHASGATVAPTEGLVGGAEENPIARRSEMDTDEAHLSEAQRRRAALRKARDTALAERLHRTPAPADVAAMFGRGGAGDAGLVRCTKVYFRLQDGLACEATRMVYPSGESVVCVSSQVGCRHRCSFCEGGRDGLVRNLTAEEMLAQVEFFMRPPADALAATARSNDAPHDDREGSMPSLRFVRATEQREDGEEVEVPLHTAPDGDAGAVAVATNRPDVAAHAGRVDRVCFHGMGEPLDNPNLVSTLHALHDGVGLRHAIPMDRVSVSTIGILKGLRLLLRECPAVRLSLSLHSPFPFERMRLVPSEVSNPLPEVLRLCRRWYQATGTPVSLAYLMLPGVNDTPRHAAALARLIQDSLTEPACASLADSEMTTLAGTRTTSEPACARSVGVATRDTDSVPYLLTLLQYAAGGAPAADPQRGVVASDATSSGAPIESEVDVPTSAGGVETGMRPSAARLDAAVASLEVMPAGTATFVDMLAKAGLDPALVRSQQYCESA